MKKISLKHLQLIICLYNLIFTITLTICPCYQSLKIVCVYFCQGKLKDICFYPRRTNLTKFCDVPQVHYIEYFELGPTPESNPRPPAPRATSSTTVSRRSYWTIGAHTKQRIGSKNSIVNLKQQRKDFFHNYSSEGELLRDEIRRTRTFHHTVHNCKTSICIMKVTPHHIY